MVYNADVLITSGSYIGDDTRTERTENGTEYEL